jgi:hypothetical protein
MHSHGTRHIAIALSRLKRLPLFVLLSALLALCPSLTACQSPDTSVSQTDPPSSTPKDSHGNYILTDTQEYGTKTGLAPGDTDFIQDNKTAFDTWFPQGYTYQTYQANYAGTPYTRYIVTFDTYTADQQIAWQGKLDFNTFNSPSLDSIYLMVLQQIISQEVINDDLGGTQSAAFNQIVLSPTNQSDDSYYWNPDKPILVNYINSYNCNFSFCNEDIKPIKALAYDDINDSSQIAPNVSAWLQVAEAQSLQGPLQDNPLWKAAKANNIGLNCAAFSTSINPPYQQYHALAKQKAKDFGIDAYYDDNGTMTKA